MSGRDPGPRICSGDAAVLLAELAQAFGALLDLHRAARDSGQHVVVSIL